MLEQSVRLDQNAVQYRAQPAADLVGDLPENIIRVYAVKESP
jgi:hypothetical protein